MNEVKDAINGYTKPLETLLSIINADALATTALDVVATCKQIEELTDLVKKTLVAKANAEYQELIKTPSDSKQWPVLAGEALVSKYGAKGTWLYSPDVVKADTALKALMKEEQASGKAKKLPAKEDPTRYPLYAITLKQMPIVAQPTTAAKSLDNLEPVSV